MQQLLEQIFKAIRDLAGRVDWVGVATDPDFLTGIALIVKAIRKHEVK